MYREFLHPGLVAKDRAVAALTAGVDGKYGELGVLILQHMQSKHVDRRALASAWHTSDAYAARLARMRQTLLNNLLCYCLMVGIKALDQRHRLPQHRGVSLEDALHIVVHRQLRTALATLHVGVHNGHLLDARVHLKPRVLLVVLGVLDIGRFHIVVLSYLLLLLLREETLVIFLYCMLCNLAICHYYIGIKKLSS